ncbi:hypothetical protein ABRD05_16175 [Bacillus velezensis]
MNKKFGLYIRGELVKTYDDAVKAHKDAIFAQEVIGVPHEVIQMNLHMDEAIEFLNNYDSSSKSAQDAQKLLSSLRYIFQQTKN